MRGAILTGLNQPLEVVDDLAVIEPRAGEVKVKMHTTGICHSDLSVIDGTIMQMLPCVLGHEGSGTVESIGEGVTQVSPGDHVILSFVSECGKCFFCERGESYLCEIATQAMAQSALYDGTPAFNRSGSPVRQMSGCGTFAEYTVVPEGGVVKIDSSISLEAAALVGCGVTTGVGAVLNTARVQPGSSIAVIGTGGVGLNVIQGAVIAGAERIIAIDLLENKLEMARQFGATDTVNASDGDPVAAVKSLTDGRGADYTFEVIGFGSTMNQAYQMARRGGTVVLVGVPKMGDMLNLMAFFPVFENKAIKGCWYGSSRTHDDFPKYLDYYKEGKLKLDELITREFTLDEINEGFEALKNGEVARGVVRLA